MFLITMRRTALTLVALLLVAAPAGAAEHRRHHAEHKRQHAHHKRHHERRTVDDNPRLWATVNICDTRKRPDTIGIRASMPGSGRRGERMFMRFSVQYHSHVDRLWHNFLHAEGTRSGRVLVGSARYKARQSGWSFPFDLGEDEAFRLRGKVVFEWRKHGRTVRRAVKRTTSHHRPSFADPKRYSAASCIVRG